MNSRGCLWGFATAAVTLCGWNLSAADLSEPPTQYIQGYDPASIDGDDTHLLPDDVWGKVVNGLQAAVRAPKKIRLNEVVKTHLVLRNVSPKTIRVSLPKHPLILNVQRVGGRFTYTVNGRSEEWQSWELKSGHQADISCPPVQVLAPGDFGLRNALTQLKAGEHLLYAHTGTNGDRLVTGDDGIRREAPLPKGDWTGWLSTAKRPIEIVGEKASFGVTPHERLPVGHGLKYVVGRTPFSTGRTEWIELGDGLTFALNGSSDEHWLADHGTYNRGVYWGPIPAGRLKALKLLDEVKQLSQEYIASARFDHQIDHRMAVLITCQQPLTEIGLEFAARRKKPKPTASIPSDYLVRTIRDRRVELIKMGLAEPMNKAIALLTQDDPSLPDDSQFQVISAKTTPADLDDDAWGPENDGLRAAALMPDSITAGTSEPVRLFIRNVSESDIRLAISERAGYDYATAVDADGNQLERMRPLVYPNFFASVITAELNPGQTTQYPPTATLAKIRLNPRAILELSTKTALHFHTPEQPVDYVGITPPAGKPAVTYIKTKSTTAWVTWHLHTANGAIHSKDLKRRLWPAKGGWSGLLRTAPLRVNLQP